MGAAARRAWRPTTTRSSGWTRPFDRQTLRARAAASSATWRWAPTSRTRDLMRHYTRWSTPWARRPTSRSGSPARTCPAACPPREFVGWYNGHPDYRELEPDLSGRRAVIIGNGNVAADVARMLTLERRASWSAPTPPTTRSRRCARARIEEVVVLGRRGPAQAAFTSAELRELGHLDGVDAASSTRPRSSSTRSREEWLAEEGTFTARKNVELLREFAARRAAARRRGGGSSCASCARRWPSAATGRVEAVEVRRNRDRARRRRRAACAAGRTRSPRRSSAALVLRSVGYRAVPLPDVPFDERRYVLPNERGRVLHADSGEPLPGVYAVGWIKRGPTGILGTNKRDAEETVALPGGGPARPARCPAPPSPASTGSTRCWPRKARTLVTRRGLAGDRRAGARARPRERPPAGQAGVARRAAGRGRIGAAAAP